MHSLFSLPIVLDFMLDLFEVSFGFWFHPFFLPQFVFSANRRPPGLISVSFGESSVSVVRVLIVFLDFNFFNIEPAHFHLRPFYPLFLDSLKWFNFDDLGFTGFFYLPDNVHLLGDVIEPIYPLDLAYHIKLQAFRTADITQLPCQHYNTSILLIKCIRTNQKQEPLILNWRKDHLTQKLEVLIIEITYWNYGNIKIGNFTSDFLFYRNSKFLSFRYASW